MMYAFEPFPKIPRLNQSLYITEKLDGTNAQVCIVGVARQNPYGEGLYSESPYCIDSWSGQDDTVYQMFVGSRKRWIAPEGTEGLEKGCDNYAFARWVNDNHYELRTLGEGKHYGEWFGKGIQRNYGLDEKCFALFNAVRWNDDNPNRPDCCTVVPVVPTNDPDEAMEMLASRGSIIKTSFGKAFNNPEGIIVYNPGSKSYFKKTFVNDQGKWSA